MANDISVRQSQISVFIDLGVSSVKIQSIGRYNAARVRMKVSNDGFYFDMVA